jgi:hypothetical protein
MTEPSVELHRGIYQALVASEALKAAMGGAVRAYDSVQPNAAFPYITFSEDQALDDSNSCDAERYEFFVDLHVWSRNPNITGMAEAKAITGIIRTLMLALEVLNGWRIPVRDVQARRHFYDADRITVHGVLTVRFLLETTGD